MTEKWQKRVNNVEMKVIIYFYLIPKYLKVFLEKISNRVTYFKKDSKFEGRGNRTVGRGDRFG